MGLAVAPSKPETPEKRQDLKSRSQELPGHCVGDSTMLMVGPQRRTSMKLGQTVSVIWQEFWGLNVLCGWQEQRKSH